MLLDRKGEAGKRVRGTDHKALSSPALTYIYRINWYLGKKEKISANYDLMFLVLWLAMTQFKHFHAPKNRRLGTIVRCDSITVASEWLFHASTLRTMDLGGTKNQACWVGVSPSDYIVACLAAAAQPVSKFLVPINHLDTKIWENRLKNTKVTHKTNNSPVLKLTPFLYIYNVWQFILKPGWKHGPSPCYGSFIQASFYIWFYHQAAGRFRLRSHINHCR